MQSPEESSPYGNTDTPFADAGLTGQDVIVGVMDTGLDETHCMFYDEYNDVGPDHRKVVFYEGGANPNNPNNPHILYKPNNPYTPNIPS